jgi:hypothetical protein
MGRESNLVTREYKCNSGQCTQATSGKTLNMLFKYVYVYLRSGK